MLHHINHPVEISFDPKAIPELCNRIYRILWVSLAYQHLKDQYFAKNVAVAVRRIKKDKPQEFKDFLKIIRGCGFHGFGRATRGYCPRGSRCRSRHRGINKKWWRNIWNLIKFNGDVELIQTEKQ